MDVYRRDDSPHYYADLVHPTTGARIRWSTHQKNKRDAQRAAQAKIEELQQEAALGRDGKRPITIAQATREYLDYLRAHKKPSWSLNDYLRRKLVGDHAELRGDWTGRWSIDGSRYLHSLEPIDIEHLTRARLAEGNSAQTIAHEIKLLRAATRYCAGLRYRTPEAFTGPSSRDAWRMPKLPKKTRWLTWDEWTAVYDELSPDRPIMVHGHPCAPVAAIVADRENARDLFVVLTLVGGRWGEIKRLTWDRIDTAEFGSVRLWATKSEAERWAPLPAQAAEVLRRRYAARDISEALVFPGRVAGAPRWACRPITRAFERAGLNTTEKVAANGRATIHSLRHTFASWLLQHGADLSAIQDALGHTSLQMTRRYAHLAQRSTARQLAGILDNVTASHTAAP